MKYIVAVSGGVDSVVLLDILVRKNEYELVVAHFDHGIRGEESHADARFVQGLSRRYGLEFEIGFGGLPKKTSEATAREARYKFLQKIAKKHDAKIATAHHRDDILETITINLLRGTGWRGLAVLGDKNLERPLLGYTKQKNYEYALSHNLEWVEDATNNTDLYLRNKIRKYIPRLSISSKENLLKLWQKQSYLRQEIDNSIERIRGSAGFSRYFFIMIEEKVAIELIRSLVASKLTRPQMYGVLHSIKTCKSGSIFEAGAGVSLRFSVREFTIDFQV